MARPPTSVVEYPLFRARAERLLSTEERLELIDYVASAPRIGKAFPGTGGARCLKWPLPEKGRKEKVQLGYYHADNGGPVLLVTLTKDGEKNLLAKIIRGLAGGD